MEQSSKTEVAAKERQSDAIQGLLEGFLTRAQNPIRGLYLFNKKCFRFLTRQVGLAIEGKTTGSAKCD